MRHRRLDMEDMAAGEWRTDAAQVRAMVGVLESLATPEAAPPP